MTPRGIDLLVQAATELREGLAPRLSGAARYQALLAANAVATAAREARAAPHLARAEEALADLDLAAIRAGAHDSDSALHARLRACAAIRAWIADPRSLSAQDRAEHLPEDLHDT
ncbi:MAG: hypothetical protein JJU42_12900 [Rhodobacteraceae bacterium]|nr:hypothetical protein [Paracoccaceae bacterium]